MGASRGLARTLRGALRPLEGEMNGGSLLRRLSSGPARVCGLVAGGLGLVVTLTAAVPPAGPQHGAAPPHQRPTALPNFLTGVSALSASDAWAVGSLGDVSTKTLALHWNGTAWARVPTPSPGRFPELTSVSAASAADAWAVGLRPTLALHWNGAAWTRAAIPHLEGGFLQGVSTLSASDAWAVGNFTAGKTAKTLVLHWNGTAWAQVPSPNVNGNGALFGVAALSPTDAWAVGDYTAGRDIKTLVLHWNGRAWVHMASPSPGRSPLNDSLSGVSVLSASNAWAVGASGHGHTQFSPQKTLVLHWNGSRWTQVPAPSPRGIGTSPFTVLTGVSARSPGDAWAVGCACSSDFDTTLVLHWNGTAWARS